MRKGYKLFFKYKKIYDSCKTEVLRSIISFLSNKLLSKYGASISINARISSTAFFPHDLYGIFISCGSKIGNNCIIFQQVTIGSNTLKNHPKYGAPTIGNNVYIGAGAKIIGKCSIGNNVRIGANCVITTDIPDNCTVVLEKPRIIIKDKYNDNTFFDYRSNAQ